MISFVVVALMDRFLKLRPQLSYNLDAQKKKKKKKKKKEKKRKRNKQKEFYNKTSR